MKYTTKHIDNYVVIVSDEEIECACKYIVVTIESYKKLSRFCSSKEEAYQEMRILATVLNHQMSAMQILKIIAHKPLKDKSVIEGIPVFDIPVEWGVDVDKLSKESFVHKKNKEGEQYTQLVGANPNGWRKHLTSFKKGYNKRAETHLFTEENLRRAIDLYRSGKNIDYIIQSLLKPQEYEVEISPIEDGKMKIIKWQKIL